MDLQQKFFSLIRFSLCRRGVLPEGIAKEDWPLLFYLCKKHSLLGVAFRGVKKMPVRMCPEKPLLLQWFAVSERIAQQNRETNANAANLSRRLAADGFRTCILKGQGNTLYYPEAYVRTPGDIDVWVEGEEKRIIAYVKRFAPDAKACYHHIDAPDYGGTPVEVHYRPSFQFNFLHNKRIQAWFAENADEQFSNVVVLPDLAGYVAVPTLRFNRVFQMSHIANHVLHEGIGLRQLMDYYFLLKKGFSEEERKEFACLMRRFGMYKMARAVMYVLREVFGLEEKLLIVEPHERCGRMLLDEIMLAGNFGHYDERISEEVRKSPIKMNLLRLRRDWRMLWYFPSECLAEPFFRIYHFFWRLMMRFRV